VVDAEQRLEAGRGDAARSNDLDAVKRANRLGQGEMDGDRHDTQLGEASIMATSTPPASSARYSVCPGCRNRRPGEFFFWMDLVTSPAISPASANRAPRSMASRVAGALTGSGWPARTGPRNCTERTGSAVRRRRRRQPPRDLVHRDIETELVGEGRQADGVVEDEEGPRTALAHRPGFEG